VNARTTTLFVAASLSVLAVVLWLDAPGLSRQLALSLPVWLLLGAVFATHPHLTKETLIAIAIATTGEVILSIGLGIYSYRSGGIPLYVPPGHGVVYLMALQTSRHIGRFRSMIERTTFAAGSVVAVCALVLFNDTFGLLCWGVMLLIAVSSPRRLLIATCVLFTTVLEIAGTWAGNWIWHEFQGLLRSGNPPVGVVLLYCCLDLLTISALVALRGRSESVTPELVSNTPTDPSSSGNATFTRRGATGAGVPPVPSW
jgi:hypothetical protein